MADFIVVGCSAAIRGGGRFAAPDCGRRFRLACRRRVIAKVMMWERTWDPHSRAVVVV